MIELGWLFERQPGDRDLRKRSRQAKEPGMVLEDGMDRGRRKHRQAIRLAQQHDAERMIGLRVGEHDSFDRDLTNVPSCAGRWQKRELLADVGRCVQNEPAAPVAADRRRRMPARPCRRRIHPRKVTPWTPAVPLGEAAAGSASEQEEMHANVRSASVDAAANASGARGDDIQV